MATFNEDNVSVPDDYLNPDWERDEYEVEWTKFVPPTIKRVWSSLDDEQKKFWAHKAEIDGHTFMYGALEDE